MLSKYLSNIIFQIIRENVFVKGSWDFHNIIKYQEIPSNPILCSIDVTSLFTNLPKDTTLNCIPKRRFDIEKCTVLNMNEFMEGVKLCLNSTFFIYDTTHKFLVPIWVNLFRRLMQV